jgi:hypothetical protein
MYKKIFFIILIWWLIFLPGFYSSDSFGVLHMVRDGNFSNIYTAQWPEWFWLLSFGGKLPGIVSLVDGLILAYSFNFWAARAFGEANRRILRLLFVASPMVAAFGITLWHDILMTSGLLILAGLLQRMSDWRRKFGRKQFLILVIGVFLSSFRPNGIPIVILSLIIVTLFNAKYLLSWINLGTSIIVSFAFMFLPSLAIGVSPVAPIYAQEWMRSDISCVLSRNLVIPLAQERELTSIAPISTWTSSAGCSWFNNLDLSQSQLASSTHVIPRVWVEIAKGYPSQILSIHNLRNHYLVPSPFGQTGVPFLHSTVEIPNAGVAWNWPSIANKARVFPRVWNAGRVIFGFAGAWILILAIRAIREARLRGTLVIGFALACVLFVFAPIPDGRYAWFILLTGQYAFLTWVINFVASRFSAIQRLHSKQNS